MEAPTRAAISIPRLGVVRVDAPGLAAWSVPILLIVYLALNNGGFGEIERSQAGVAVWWAVLVGTAVGALPLAGGTRSGRALFALLAAFAGWTALSLTWTESDGRTATELARVATYLGVFALALAVQGGRRWRHLLHGVTAGVTIVCGIAVLSRLEPTWFPRAAEVAAVTAKVLPGIEIEHRLSYPLNYSSGLGALAAIGLPLLLGAASSARTLAAQALAAAALPVVTLTLWLTASGLSLPVAGIALVAFLVLAPDRLPKLATLATAAAGSAILLAAIEQRPALDRGLPTAAAQQQGDEMLLITIVACAGVAIVQIGIGLAARYGRRPGWLRIGRAHAAAAFTTASIAILAVVLAALLSGELSDRWERFKGFGGGSPTEQSRGDEILDLSSSGRYQFWEVAVDAHATDPWKGIGPGTFQLWGAREGTYAGTVVDAHSLYVETLGELGWVGLLLVGSFSLAVLLIGAGRAARAPPEARLTIAMATAGCAAFVAAAFVDWVWELGVLAVIFVALAAVAVAGGVEPRRSRPGGPRRPAWQRHGGRIAMIALAAAALVAIVPPLGSATQTERSRDAAVDGRLSAALDHARDAISLQPYAATPHLQEALVLEQQGKFRAAAEAAREAARREPTNWRHWAILSRLRARSGRVGPARAALRKARSLRPESTVLAP